MKVLCLSNNSEIIGGADRVFKNEAFMLARGGHDVLTFSASKECYGFFEGDDSSPNDFMTTFFDYHNQSLASRIKNIPKFFYRSDVAADLEQCLSLFKPDVAHLHITYGQLSNSILKVLKKNKIKIVMTIHDYRLICPASTMLDPEGKICSKCFDDGKSSAVFKRCGGVVAAMVNSSETAYRDKFNPYQSYVDHFIFVSRFCYELHVKYFPELGSKSTVINNFADIPLNEVKTLKRTNNKCYAYFGRLAREKGLDTLCDAFVGFDRNLIIIGTGPEEGRLREKYIHCSNIEFKGFMEKAKFEQFLRLCTFSILPSEWYENYPMSVLESYVLGLPVIAAEVGGIPEMIDHGVTGFLFSSGEQKSLIQLLAATDILPINRVNEMARLGLNFFKENNSSETHLKKLIKVYKRLITRNRS